MTPQMQQAMRELAAGFADLERRREAGEQTVHERCGQHYTVGMLSEHLFTCPGRQDIIDGR